MRDAILEGEIAPGAVMSQASMAEDLGVSRTPLREALRMLQSEGLVDAQANRRVTVKPISTTDLEVDADRMRAGAGEAPDLGAASSLVDRALGAR